jgi:probable HAF family extracellular repeat protein
VLGGALLGWLSTASALAQQAAPRYTVVDRGLSLVRTLTDTPGLNNRGDVAIWHPVSASQMPGVVMHGQESISIDGAKGFPLVYPADINDRMMVAGAVQAELDLRFTHAFRWANHQMELLEALGGPYSTGLAINAAGVVAGSAQANNGARHAAVWKAKQPRDLGLLGHGDYSSARDINDQGDVVGEANAVATGKPQAFLWHGGKMRQLPTLPGGTTCSAQAINNSGVVIGSCDLPNGLGHSVIWRNGSVEDLGIIGEAAEASSLALDINSRNQVVGVAQPEDGKLKAFLWEKGKMIDLNQVIDPHSGWKLLVASRINDQGEILGRGYLKGSIHAFSLEPCSSRAKSGGVKLTEDPHSRGASK